VGAASPAGDAASPAGDAVASPKSWICDTTHQRIFGMKFFLAIKIESIELSTDTI